MGWFPDLQTASGRDKDVANGAVSLRHLTCLALRLPQSYDTPYGETGGENTRPETDSSLEEDF